MTPQQVMELIRIAIEHGGSIAEAWESTNKKPPTVADRIMDRVVAQSLAADAPRPTISSRPDGTYQVDGVDMTFTSPRDAEIAADVVARVRAAER